MRSRVTRPAQPPAEERLHDAGEPQPAPPAPATLRRRTLVPLCVVVAPAVAVLLSAGLALPAVYGMAGAAIAVILLSLTPTPRRSTRVAIVGTQESAVALEQEFEINPVGRYTFVGWIARDAAADDDFPRPRPLGSLSELGSLARRHQIDLVLVGRGVPRLEVFDKLLAVAATEPVRACELCSFYEDAFGHIPLEEINSAWFQYVVHPRFPPADTPAKRALDIVGGAAVGLACLPLLAISALLIKLDGGPVLYRQLRIGERGRPFTIYKLRTMRMSAEPEAQRWCSSDDPRVTRVGQLLRRLHIDELPQLYNVLRGEMSLVGPRPEQPELVARLESGLAFYSRRHLVKPGLTGWAQIRCGYARSESGSAWKLCHDLYYLRHRSLAFDLEILVRTIAVLASSRSAELRESERSTPSREGGARVEQSAPSPVGRS
ncbi:MAG TPA: sugar transferase [Solirubrobacteraceae bacterium]|nr:sugar transferase [Solirubrobacteraceae bacterium]